MLQVITQRAPEAAKLLKRIALIGHNPEHDPARMEFAEDLAANRGVNMRLFNSVAAAEPWLGEAPEGAR